MSKKIKEFLNENKKLLNDGIWCKLFDNAIDEQVSTFELAKLLHEANIDYAIAGTYAEDNLIKMFKKLSSFYLMELANFVLDDSYTYRIMPKFNKVQRIQGSHIWEANIEDFMDFLRTSILQLIHMGYFSYYDLLYNSYRIDSHRDPGMIELFDDTATGFSQDQNIWELV